MQRVPLLPVLLRCGCVLRECEVASFHLRVAREAGLHHRLVATFAALEVTEPPSARRGVLDRVLEHELNVGGTCQRLCRSPPRRRGRSGFFAGHRDPPPVAVSGGYLGEVDRHRLFIGFSRSRDERGDSARRRCSRNQQESDPLHGVRPFKVHTRTPAYWARGARVRPSSATAPAIVANVETALDMPFLPWLARRSLPGGPVPPPEVGAHIASRHGNGWSGRPSRRTAIVHEDSSWPVLLGHQAGCVPFRPDRISPCLCLSRRGPPPLEARPPALRPSGIAWSRDRPGQEAGS